MIAVHQHAEGDDHGAADRIPDPTGLRNDDRGGELGEEHELLEGHDPEVDACREERAVRPVVAQYFLRDFELRLTVPAA